MTNEQTSATKVLVIDDEEVVHASLRKVLTRRGYEVHAVFSAREGLQLLDREEFGLLISDLMLRLEQLWEAEREPESQNDDEAWDPLQ